MESLREIQRGIIQDIRILTNVQTNQNQNQNQNQNTRNRNTSHNNANRDYVRRNYYGPTNAQNYEPPFRFDFFPNTTTENTARTNYVNTLWNNFDTLYANVIVRPTALEIQNGTRNIVFSEIENPLNVNCPISLEPFTANAEVTRINGCGHIFHTDSLNSWFQRNVRCPVCRYDIRTSQEETPIDTPLPESEITDISNNDLVGSLTNLTENILTQLFNPTTGNNIRLHRGNTRVTYDPSNNEIIFRGFY